MIRNRLHLLLIDRGRGAGLDAAGVDVLLRLASRDVSLHVESALARQILALLLWTGVPDDDQLGIWILLQLERNIVQFGLAGVVDAPRLHKVGVLALVHLAGLWRWRRRWRVLNRHRARGRSRQAARVRTS